jgi:hypothetical protein
LGDLLISPFLGFEVILIFYLESCLADHNHAILKDDVAIVLAVAAARELNPG